MENLERYKHLNKYLKDKFGERTLKICIDGGFTCPNRNIATGRNGCIFCSERGSGEHMKSTPDISAQVQNYFKSYKAERANKFIAYFQNFTNTFAPVDVLKAKYDASLIDDRIVALAVATRPDCISEEVCKLLKTYTQKYHVWVELGLQTENDRTAEIINRGYKKEVFAEAMRLLKKYSVPVVAHMIIGLPGESGEDAVRTAKYLSDFGVDGIKIHSIYVMEGTRLADMYRKKLYTPPTLSEYAETAAKCLGNISPEIIIHRITGDCPKDLLIAPDWNKDKNAIIGAVREAMEEKRITQGSLITG